MIELKQVSKIYKAKSGETAALREITIKFAETGLNFILGKSGCGKSTLLNLIGGLDRPTSGTIWIDGKNSTAFTESEMDAYRNSCVGFVFQEYNLIENHTVGFNINLAMELHGKKVDRSEVDVLLRKLGLVDEDGETLYSRYVNELSGGQKQRVAIARALIKKPNVILADEPTGALDSETGRELYELLKKISLQKTVIVVTHDRVGAEEFGDRIIELSDGKIISDTVTEVNSRGNKGAEYQKSRLPFCRVLLMGAEGIKAGPVRFLLSVFLTVITLILFGFAYSANFSDENSTFIRTMYDHDYSIVILSKRGGFSESEYNEIVKFNGGNPPIICFEGINTIENTNWGKTSEAVSDMNNPYISAGYSYFFDSSYAEVPEQIAEEEINLRADERFENKTLCRMPNDFDEIAITDLIFDAYRRCGYLSDEGQYIEIQTPDDMIGKTICGFKVCGVYSTEIDCDFLRVYDHDNYGMTEREIALGESYELDEPAHSYFTSVRDSVVAHIFVKEGFTAFHKGTSVEYINNCAIKLSGDFNKDYKLLSDLEDNESDMLFTPKSIVTSLISRSTFWMNPTTQEYLKGLTMALAAFSVLLMLNCLLTSIEQRRRELGVLRALGAGAKDLIKICLTESVMSSGVSFILGVLGVGVLCHLANVYYYVSIFGLHVTAALFMFLLSVGFTVVATLLAAVNIARKKPIDIMNGK